MNKSEIIAALNEVRDAGHSFTNAFNKLSDIIEVMAGENETLHETIAAKDKEIASREEGRKHKQDELNAVYSRVAQIESDNWEITQQVNRHKSEISQLTVTCTIQHQAIEAKDQELHELRPFRHQVVSLNSDLADLDATISSLREEVSKLLEIILNVATSVDGVVNKPVAKPRLVEDASGPTEAQTHQARAHYEETVSSHSSHSGPHSYAAE